MKREIPAYEHFTTAEFLVDEYFQQWVQRPGQETDAFWQEWLKTHPHKQREITEARSLLGKLQFQTDTPADESMDRVWQNIVAANQASDRQLEITQTGKMVPLNRFRYWRQAAAVVVLLVMGTAGYLFLQNTTPLQQYNTAFGEVKTVVLPDGSHVKLNANSTLRIPAKWTTLGQREVWLDGEAYFSVKHTRNHQRFVVHLTDSTQVEVLGTEFIAFQRKRGTRVALASGKVKFDIERTKGKHEVYLKPGEMVENMDKASEYVKEKTDPATFSSWTEGKLVFDDVPLPEVLIVLEETYGLNITVADSSLLQKRVWGSIPMENEEVMLQVLSRIFDWKFTRDGNQVVLSDSDTSE
jgi:ferric-dicitrate binding protein FerR (iron transport regulator)